MLQSGILENVREGQGKYYVITLIDISKLVLYNKHATEA